MKSTIWIWPDDEDGNICSTMTKNPHRGSNLRDLLKEDGVLEEVETRAWKRALARQLRRLLEQRELTKSEMAARMKTSRAVVDRLLDESNPSVTLATLEKAASALGAKLRIELIPA